MARVEAMVRKGHPDRDIIKEVAVEFDVSENTIRSDLKRLWNELRATEAEKRPERREVMRYQLESLQVEAREVAQQAREGFAVMGPEGETVVVQDMKTASMALASCEKIFGRLAMLDGIAESDRVKLEVLRQKLLKDSGLTQEQLDAMLKAEVDKAIDEMPLPELEKRLARRRGDVVVDDEQGAPMQHGAIPRRTATTDAQEAEFKQAHEELSAKIEAAMARGALDDGEDGA